jgi:hypothetical protein
MRDGVERSVDLSTDARVSHRAQPWRVRRWLREPLLHFLLLGVVLFVAYSSMERGRGGTESSKQIQLTLDDLG